MVYAVTDGKLGRLHKPTYQAPSALRLADRTQDYAALYREQNAVRTVVDFLARNIAQLSLHTFRRLDDNDRERVRDHPVARLLARPNPYTTPYRFMRALVSDRGIYDRALLVKVTTKDGEPTLVRIPPRLWTIPDDESWLHPSGFIVEGSRGKAFVKAEDTVYFRGYNPEDERWGLSTIESLRRALAEEYAAGQMREQVLRNGARASGYLERPVGAPTWSPQARERFRTGWRSQYSGQSATEGGGTPILEDGMKFVQASQTAEDLQYVQARKLTREEVASAFHIPPPMLGMLENATFSNITEQHKMLYQDTLGPMLRELEQEFALQVLPDFDDVDGVYVEFNLAEKMRGSFEEQAAQLQTSVGGPYMTRNEARGRANLPAIEGGDELIVPLNVLVGGQASPTDSTGAAAGAPAGALAALSGGDLKERVEAATALIRAGFDPSESLVAVGLDPIKHLGLLPVTIQKPIEPEGEVDDELVSDITKQGLAPSVKARPSDDETGAARDVLAAFFDRQARAVQPAIRSGGDWWDEQRWVDELADDLTPALAAITVGVAARQLRRLGLDEGNFNEEQTVNYLAAVARSTSESINTVTKDQLDAALEADDALEQVAHVFDVAATARADQGGLTLATGLAGWATVEAVEQARGSRGATKTWTVNSGNPRPSHAAMAGETVPLDDTFSNGARWPGDSSALDVDEVAGCSCDVVINLD
ncbi:phage portal protein [Agrococcus sp. SL85]|uniref:phage portal protein n=1 Tax=Agrococcus sp. SL85 TaxID=2995141 RepID=UPI00226D268B|nr:phage portal protein [Agrococcus sp. SL85]WAC65175.1 phage portal protein [Agrococcus sp. SL85]